MKFNEFFNLIEISKNDGVLIVLNDNNYFLNNLEDGEVISCKIVNNRDLKLHRAYFAFLNSIYYYLPAQFKNKIDIQNFYKFIQTLKKEYKVLFQFKDGTKLLQYDSISFSNMSEFDFRKYIKEQIPYIYDNIISEFYDEINSKKIIEKIEHDFEKFLTKLYANGI